MITATSATANPPATAASSARVKLTSDFDNFLTMLVTQLRHQDPLDPLKTNEFTQQLVMFASVEQQIQQNANLETLIKAQQQGQAVAAVGYIGQSVEIAGDQLPLQDGRATASYGLGSKAEQVTVTIKNAAGQVVATLPGETAAGRHTVSWNGEDLNGKPLPDGLYRVEVKAIDKGGNALPVQTSVFGRVTGTGSENGGTVLLIDDAWVSLDEVVAVHQPAAPADNR